MAYGSCGKAGKARADGSGVGAGSTCAGADAPTPPGDPDDDIAVIPRGRLHHWDPLGALCRAALDDLPSTAFCSLLVSISANYSWEES